MFRFRRPSANAIAAALAEREEASFSYEEVGATRGGWRALPPSLRDDFDVDRHEIVLGAGAEVFARAREALFAWGPFACDWLELHGAGKPVAVGAVVATLGRAAGLWTLNPCRVVYVQDDPGRAAFAYGTLRGHAEVGEERFEVVHDPQTDAVRYGILAMSRPGPLIAQLGYPYARRVQTRFRESSAAAMLRAGGGGGEA